MANAAERFHTPDPKSAYTEALQRLLANLANRSRDGAGSVTLGTANAPFWSDLERTIATLMDTAETLTLIRAREDAITAAALAHLAHADNRDQRRSDYLTMLGEIDARGEAWSIGIPADVLAQQLHRTLLWGTAWHLLGAGTPMAQVVRVLEAMPPDNQATARSPVADTVRPALAAAATATQLLAASLVRGTKKVVSAFDEAHQTSRDHAARVRQNPPQTTAAPPAEPAELWTAPVAAPKARTVVNLDGRRLQGSIIGTWLMLVVLSWVSLIWGALISAPFGVGLGIAATAGIGIFAVPLWGTIWGFLGMNAARTDTLRTMGFEPAAADSRIVAIATDQAQRLGIPVPQVGTIPAFNAFAMGKASWDATIAIGNPLMGKLTEQETAAVIGHELGHVVSGDIRRMMLMRTFQNALVWFGLAQGIKQVARWVICWATELVILAFSRSREYRADAIGAALTSKEAMIGALRKLDDAPKLSDAENTHARFMFRGRLRSTHPSTADRIRALETETYIRRLPIQNSSG